MPLSATMVGYPDTITWSSSNAGTIVCTGGHLTIDDFTPLAPGNSNGFSIVTKFRLGSGTLPSHMTRTTYNFAWQGNDNLVVVGSSNFNFRFGMNGRTISCMIGGGGAEFAGYNGINGIGCFGSKSFSQNKWYTVGVTYDGLKAATGIRLYANGTALNTTVLADQIYTIIGVRGVDSISDYNSPQGEKFSFGGNLLELDWFKVWTRRLTAREVQQVHFSEGLDPSTVSVGGF